MAKGPPTTVAVKPRRLRRPNERRGAEFFLTTRFVPSRGDESGREFIATLHVRQDGPTSVNHDRALPHISPTSVRI